MTLNSNSSDETQRRWHALNRIERIDPNRISAEANVPATSPWFEGHFPGEPILPGIAQIALVKESIRAVFGSNLTVDGLKRVRFKQVILPDEPITIEVNAQGGEPASFDFRLLFRNEVAASGVMMMKQTA